jgi:hypothetical protein
VSVIGIFGNWKPDRLAYLAEKVQPSVTTISFEVPTSAIKQNPSLDSTVKISLDIWSIPASHTSTGKTHFAIVDTFHHPSACLYARGAKEVRLPTIFQNAFKTDYFFYLCRSAAKAASYSIPDPSKGSMFAKLAAPLLDEDLGLGGAGELQVLLKRWNLIGEYTQSTQASFLETNAQEKTISLATSLCERSSEYSVDYIFNETKPGPDSLLELAIWTYSCIRVDKLRRVSEQVHYCIRRMLIFDVDCLSCPSDARIKHRF